MVPRPPTWNQDGPKTSILEPRWSQDLQLGAKMAPRPPTWSPPTLQKHCKTNDVHVFFNVFALLAKLHTIDQTINRSRNQSSNQPNSKSISQPIKCSINQSVNPSMNQSINDAAINQSINQAQEGGRRQGAKPLNICYINIHHPIHCL